MIEKETRARLRELSEAAPSQTGILTAALKAIEEKKDLAGAVITFKRRTSGDMGLSEPFCMGLLRFPVAQVFTGKFSAPIQGLYTVVFSGVAFLAPAENVFIYLRNKGEVLGFKAEAIGDASGTRGAGPRSVLVSVLVLVAIASCTCSCISNRCSCTCTCICFVLATLYLQVMYLEQGDMVDLRTYTDSFSGVISDLNFCVTLTTAGTK